MVVVSEPLISLKKFCQLIKVTNSVSLYTKWYFSSEQCPSPMDVRQELPLKPHTISAQITLKDWYSTLIWAGFTSSLLLYWKTQITIQVETGKVKQILVINFCTCGLPFHFIKDLTFFRGTKDFRIETSTEVNSNLWDNRDWNPDWCFKQTLPKKFLRKDSQLSPGCSFRYLKFFAVSRYGAGAGLQYFYMEGPQI